MSSIIKRHKRGIITALLTLLPLACCCVMCAGGGTLLSRVYLPNNNWNDEVIYYKWVEGTVEHGLPQGYFGYNESHARYLNFGTWSPMLNIFWVIFGKLAGWTYLSPIICNILLMTIAMFLFALWAEPDWSQTAAVGLLFATYTGITRYMLSGMAEVSCYFPLILITGLALKKEKKKWMVPVLYLLIFCVALMRPYHILLMMIPSYIWYMLADRKKMAVCFSIVITFITGGAYIWLNQNLCAPYFSDLFQTGWLEYLLTDFWRGIFNIIHIVLRSIRIFLQYVGNGITGDSPEGSSCMFYLGMMIWMMYRCLNAYRNRDKKFIFYAYGIMVLLAVLMACFLLFDIPNGSKHLAEFTIMGIFIVSMTESLNKKIILLSCLFLYSFTMKAQSEYLYSLPVVTDEMVFELASGKEQLEKNLVLDPEADRWDNTMIWVFSDETVIKWQDLYAVPSGFGLNLCYGDYVASNFHRLKSKYLMTSIGERIDQLCDSSGAQLLAEYGAVHVWKLR